jgi:hypothetical protein
VDLNSIKIELMTAFNERMQATKYLPVRQDQTLLDFMIGACVGIEVVGHPEIAQDLTQWAITYLREEGATKAKMIALGGERFLSTMEKTVVEPTFTANNITSSRYP